MKKFCILVDGLSSGRQFPAELKNRGFMVIHVQSDPKITCLGEHNRDQYTYSFVYNGCLKMLLNDIKNTCPSESIKAVIPGSEPGVELADEIRAVFTPSLMNDPALSSARRDKYLMRQTLKKAGIANAAFYSSSHFPSVNEWVNQNTGYPVVIKPLKSAGTDGVFICNDESDLEAGFREITTKKDIFACTNETVLVESFLEGDEYIFNTVSCEGKHKVVDIWKYQKQYTQEGRKIYDREILVDFNSQEAKKLSEYVSTVLDAMGVKYGPCHAEVIIQNNQPILVELGARVSGATNINVSQKCLNIDSFNLTIDCYTDRQAFFASYHTMPSIQKSAMVIDLASKREGIVESERFTDKLSSLPSMFMMNIKIKRGGQLKKTVDLLTSPCTFYLVHENLQQLEKDYQEVIALGDKGFCLKPKVADMRFLCSNNKQPSYTDNDKLTNNYSLK